DDETRAPLTAAKRTSPVDNEPTYSPRPVVLLDVAAAIRAACSTVLNREVKFTSTRSAIVDGHGTDGRASSASPHTSAVQGSAGSDAADAAVSSARFAAITCATVSTVAVSGDACSTMRHPNVVRTRTTLVMVALSLHRVVGTTCTELRFVLMTGAAVV